MMTREQRRKWAQYAGFTIVGLIVCATPIAIVAAGLALLGVVGGLGGVLAAAALLLSARTWAVRTLPSVFLPTRNPGPYVVSAEATKLHETLLVADLHADSLMWPRDLLAHNQQGHVDVPRMVAGNVALQVFAAATKSPIGMNLEATPDGWDMCTTMFVLQGWPRMTWRSLKERALYMSQRLHDFAAHSNGALCLIKTKNDLDTFLQRRGANPGLAAGILSIEGAHCLEGELGNIDVLFEAGYRMVGLTHFFDNDVGGSAHGIVKGGLTDFGSEVLSGLEAREMTVDLAHASPRLIDDVLAASTRPVVVSHTGLKGTLDSPRNLSDEHLRAIAETGGVIGIGLWEDAVGKGGVAAVVRAIRHAVDLAGVASVALGSDFDGFAPEPFDAGGFALLTEALLATGFSEEETVGIMGGNTLRLLRATLPSVGA